MRLLFVIPEYLPHPGGGIATFYKNLLPFCVEQGHEVRVVLGSPFMLGGDKYVVDGVRVEQLEEVRFRRFMQALRRFDVFPELQRYLAAAWAAWEQADGGSGYDLIETTDWALPFVPWVLRRPDAPVQIQMHSSIGQIEHYDPRDGFQLLGGITRLIETALLKHADRIVTYSTANQQFWISQLQREIDYEVPGFAMPSAPGTATAHRAPASGDLPHGVVAGRVQYWKGPTVLCEALRRMGDRAPTITWVGRDVPYQRHTQTMGQWLAREYPDVWGKKLHPIGLRSYHEVEQLQRSADFGVVPSIWDMFNWTAVEHMSVGNPVICSRGAGVSDLVDPGTTGFLCAADDPASLCEALECLVGNWPSARTLGEQAREMVRSSMNPHQVTLRRVTTAAGVRERLSSRTQVDAWTAEFLSPDRRGSELHAFLDQLPLRDLASYTVARSVSKIRG